MPRLSPLSVELTSIEVVNLRGFTRARLPLREGLTLLVGPNNSGKTSILRILDWVLNVADEAVLAGERELNSSEYRLLMPARRTGGGARRITLHVRIPDGRRRRRFRPEGDCALLRIAVAARGRLRLNVGPPRRSEAPDTDLAMSLLEAVRTCTEFGLVPASRDATSPSFIDAFQDAVRARLEERAIHQRRAGAPAEYREVKKALNALGDIGAQLVAPLWDEMKSTLPAGLAEAGELGVSVTPEDFVEWLSRRAALRLTTGAHDIDMVPPVEVGSGLQSLLELAVQQAASTKTGGSRIIAIEEPEAFLHPSAQRTLARTIAQSLPGKRIVSTHSPLLVEEASYGDVVLVRDHRFYEPASLPADDPRRASINSALLTGFGAEMAFASSVMLVEGEGDRLYFEGLRRRLAALHSNSRIDELYVLATGSKTAYSPWIRLLTSYGREGDRPVRWLACADGDAAADMITAWAQAGLPMAHPAETALRGRAAIRATDRSGAVAATEAVNREAEARAVALHLLGIDLEHAMTERLSPGTRDMLGREIGAPGAGDLETWLRKRKHPWMRAVFAKRTPGAELSPWVARALERWLGTVLPGDEARRLIAML